MDTVLYCSLQYSTNLLYSAVVLAAPAAATAATRAFDVASVLSFPPTLLYTSFRHTDRITELYSAEMLRAVLNSIQAWATGQQSDRVRVCPTAF
jgi:hypothetical protein